MERGWISLHRDIQYHWIWEDLKLFKMWITILLNVNHDLKKIAVQGKVMVCHPGQSFRSLSDWSRLMNCSKKTTMNFFKMLEEDGMISRELMGSGNRRKSLITVINWSKYQTKGNAKVLPNRQLKNRKLAPNNNDKKIEEIINLYNKTCISLNSVQVCTKKRKGLVNAQIKEHGFETVKKMLNNAAESKFLAGQNTDNWKADFNWLFNPEIFVRVLEGKYADRKIASQINEFEEKPPQAI